jgi:hypothetical protein
LKVLRSATEPEVISEFLRSEYHQKEYHNDRHLFETMVIRPDLADEEENHDRRRLLFRRHRVTWQELPANVRWFQVQLGPEDFDKLRVFPRGHWPRIAGDSSFSLSDIVHNIRERRFAPETADDITSILAISYRLRLQVDHSSILLIGLDSEKPLVILEGNHRMIAAALAGQEVVQSFIVYAGFSPDMSECYWYQNSLSNLFHHACRRFTGAVPTLIRSPKPRRAA